MKTPKCVNSANSTQKTSGKKPVSTVQPKGSPKVKDGYAAFLARHKMSKGTLGTMEAK